MQLCRASFGFICYLVIICSYCLYTCSAHAETISDSFSLETLKLTLDSKVHYRYSERNSFPVKFPFPPSFLPVGETQGKLKTVEAGDHLEPSIFRLGLNWNPTELSLLQSNLDIFDYYERNPTSSDKRIDLDSIIFRYGTKTLPKEQIAGSTAYLQVGKFEKFERQNDRHLESYGLISTAFNRMEDSGFEVGSDISPWLYLRGSWTTGNPLFIRDPNALAGDNGSDDFDPSNMNPDPNFSSGFPILYDAEIEDFDIFDQPEFGLGIGTRFGSEEDEFFGNLLLHAYKRNLKDRQTLHGTFYGADLDIVDDVAGTGISLDVTDNNKDEYGATLWIYWQNLTIFAQSVFQQVAGFNRWGGEIETAYAFDMRKFSPEVFDMPLISSISPVFRFSALRSDISGDPEFPAPSLMFDWNKYDSGIRVNLLKNWQLTCEYAINRFETDLGTKDNNELLISLRWVAKI